jgi:hypothetical protein
MAKKPQRARQGQPPPAKKGGLSRQGLVVAAVLAVLLGAGLWVQFGGEKSLPLPPPRTADGKVVVLEFSDYG